jgi:hypothetical protein
MGKMVRRRELPCVRRLWSLHRERVVSGVLIMSMIKESVEEAKKKQRLKIYGKVI